MITEPGPELLEARQRLLDGIMATWPVMVSTVLAVPQARPVYPITIDAAVAASERYRLLWQSALAEMEAILASGTAGRVDGYWKKEHRARALYATSLLVLEALTDDSTDQPKAG